LLIVPLTLYFFSGISLKRNAILSLIVFVPAAIYMMIRISILHGIAGEKSEAIAFIDNIIPHASSFAEAKATAFMVLGRYLRLLFFPHPLVYDYSYAGTDFAKPGDLSVLLSLVIHLALLTYAIIRFRKKDIVSYGIFFYLTAIALVSNLFLLIGSNMAERFLFLPSLGFCIIGGCLAAKAAKADLLKRTASLVSLLQSNTRTLLFLSPVLIFYSFKTIQRNRDWYDNYTLYSKDIMTSPESARIKYNLGLAIVKEKVPLETDPVAKNNLLNKGIEVLQQSIAIYKSYADAYDELGVAYYHLKQYDKALENYQTALKLNPNSQNAYNNMGSSLFSMMKYPEAVEAYKKAIELDPYYADAHMNLGSAYGMMKMYDEAIASFLKSLEYRPNNIPTLKFLAMTYEFKGDNASAQDYYRKAGELEKTRGK
jgi:tetratricopeptide (TPR) repeat protein